MYCCGAFQKHQLISSLTCLPWGKWAEQRDLHSYCMTPDTRTQHFPPIHSKNSHPVCTACWLKIKPPIVYKAAKISTRPNSCDRNMLCTCVKAFGDNIQITVWYCNTLKENIIPRLNKLKYLYSLLMIVWCTNLRVRRPLFAVNVATLAAIDIVQKWWKGVKEVKWGLSTRNGATRLSLKWPQP